MRPWKHFGARLSERLWPTAPTGRRSASAGNSLSISKPITTGAGSTALWGTNHLWNSKQQTTKIERTDSTKCVHKKGGREDLWLTGYNQRELEGQSKKEKDFETFFKKAPKLNPARSLIKGVV